MGALLLDCSRSTAYYMTFVMQILSLCLQYMRDVGIVKFNGKSQSAQSRLI